MLSHFEQEELGRLTSAGAKRAALNHQKDAARTRHMELKREENHAEAVATLLASQEFQTMLENTAGLATDFKAVQQDYTKLPASKANQIARLQVANTALEAENFELQQRIERQRHREERLESSLSACEGAVNQLVGQKEQLEREVRALQEEVAAAASSRRARLAELQSEGMEEEELRAVRAGQLERAVYHLSAALKDAHDRNSHSLMALADRLLLLPGLRAHHDSAQRLFSSYSSCQSEHDLIAEEAALAAQIRDTIGSIMLEEHCEERARVECEAGARAGAVRQAREWMGRRLEEVGKKKRTVRALLEIIVPSGEAEEEEARAIENELWRLEKQEETFRERLRNQMQ